MRPVLFFFFGLLFLATSAAAQNIRVVSGEHDGFSRLVLNIGPSVDWSVEPVVGGYALELEGSAGQFDLRNAFDRIPRDRIQDIEITTEGRLFIASTCDCHIFPLDVGDGLLAIDIRDGPPGPDAVRYNVIGTDAAADAEPDTDPVSEATTSEVPRYTPPAIRLPLNIPGFTPSNSDDPSLQISQEDFEGSVNEEEPVNVPSATLADGPDDTERTDRAAETEAALLEQIARAASQGLLDAEIPGPDELLFDPSPDEHESDPEPLEPLRDRGHVAVITSVDDATRGGTKAQTDSGQVCLPDRYFEIEDWGIPLRTGADIGYFRSGIIGEFDEADGEGVTALARHYIYITFGAEALVVIARFEDDIERSDILMLMAEVMDHGAARNAMSFVEQMACDGPVALWAAAAQPKLYRYQSINTAALRGAFAALPPHLRRHLGPTLAAKFLSIDDMETADAIQAATTRVFSETSPELGLLEARRDLADGEPEAARRKLDEVVDQADELLPDALIERVEAALAHQEPVPEDVISLVKSVGFEHRGTETGAALARAEIRALASAAHYAEAFQRLDGARSDGTAAGNVSIDLSREVFSLLVDDPSDEEFLARTVARLSEAATLPTPLRRQIAIRLLDLGFSAQSRIVLGGDGALPEPQDRVIFARIALAQAKPQVAVGYLAGLESDEAVRLRAEAMSLAQDHAGAMENYTRLGDEPAAARAAWRGGFWDALATNAESPFAQAGELMRQQDSTSDLPPTPLARNESLIESSRSARETIETLMSEIDSQGSVASETADVR